MRRWLAATAALGLLALAGCGGNNVDTAKIEHQLQARVAAEAKIDPFKVAVDCPRNIADEPGRSFTCTVSYQKRRRTVVIRLEDDHAYSATIRTKTTP